MENQAIFLIGLFIRRVQVYGPSMFPTLNLAGDVLIAERVSHRLGKVGPGDVVLVKSPVDPRKTITKRIVGVEGDRVTFPVDPSKSNRCRTVVVIFRSLAWKSRD